eukprot:gene12783-biopygen9376
MSPPGYGYDCFRTYEALALGLIPILVHPTSPLVTTFKGEHFQPNMYLNLPPHTSVDANAFINVYEGLPVVLIRDITEVTAENLEKWRGEIYEKMQRAEAGEDVFSVLGESHFK